MGSHLVKIPLQQELLNFRVSLEDVNPHVLRIAK